MIQSLIDIYRHEGWLPDCRMSLCKGYTQGGSNADVVLVDAFLKGITEEVDWATGYEAVLKDAERKSISGLFSPTSDQFAPSGIVFFLGIERLTCRHRLLTYSQMNLKSGASKDVAASTAGKTYTTSLPTISIHTGSDPSLAVSAGPWNTPTMTSASPYSPAPSTTVPTFKNTQPVPPTGVISSTLHPPPSSTSPPLLGGISPTPPSTAFSNLAISTALSATRTHHSATLSTTSPRATLTLAAAVDIPA